MRIQKILTRKIRNVNTSKGFMCTQSKTLMGCQEINCARSNGRTFMCDGEAQAKLLIF